MQLPQPYLYVSPRMVGRVDRQYMRPAEGLVTDSAYGYHTFWAAEVPFIPAHTGDDSRDFNIEATNRLVRVLQRQVRFLYDLAQSHEHLATFELRFVCWPQPHGLSRVGMAFLGKTFHTDERISYQLALGLWDKFSAVFPREAPFSYPLVPVGHYDKVTSGATHSFKEWFEPLPFDQLNTPQSIIELRKYEDWPTIRDVGGVLHARDYIPHPFVPALDYSALARLIETMASQRQLCMVAITLRPQRLTDQEIVILHELAGWYDRAARGEVGIENPLVDILREQLNSNIFEAYSRTRAELGKKVYDDFVREHRSLFLVRLQVVGTPAPDDLVEALGSEVMANAGNTYPSRWSRVGATPDELRWSLFNLRWLEFARWGVSRLVQQDRRVVRLRYLATVQEAAGAFRLPVAPATGGITGLEIRDEPFLLVAPTPLEHQSGFKLGQLLDRGVPTNVSYTIPLSMLTGVVQVFGEASESRSRAFAHILNGIADIPWVLICSTGHAVAEFSQRLNARHIVVDEAMESVEQNSLAIQPLLPPPGVALTKFLDALLRILMAVYGLDATAGMFLRLALSETYQQAGWHGQECGRMIDIAWLASRIEAISDQPHVPAEIVATLQARCALPLRDLATTTGKLLAVPYAPTFSLSTPLVIENGWLGSDLSHTFVRACLWMWYTLALTATPASSSILKGIVGLEEAHLLFGAVTTASATVSPVAALAYSSNSAGVGTLLIDDRPDLLDVDITNKATITLLTHNSTVATLDRTAMLIGASSRQRTRMAHLDVSEAVIAVRGAVPAMVLLADHST